MFPARASETTREGETEQHKNWTALRGLCAAQKLVMVGMECEGLHSYFIGNVMFESSVKPSQSQSNHVEVFLVILSRETAGGVVLSRQVAKGLGMRRFDSILLC
jgi:hypothetical protein